MHGMNNWYEECYESLWFSVLWRELVKEHKVSYEKQKH